MISAKGLDLIKSFESFRASPYLDSAGIPTIGYGTIFYGDNTKVKMSDPDISEDRAIAILKANVSNKCKAIENMVTVSLNQNQIDALCSLVYNIGVHALQTSTLLFLLNQGLYASASEQFSRWDMADGKVIDGLLQRRKKEAALFNMKV